MKRLLIGLTMAMVAGLMSVGLASASAPVTVNVALSEFKIEMSSANLPAGTSVTYVITNNGKLKHEMVLEKAGVVDEPLAFNGAEQEAEDIEPGTTRTVEWTIPEAGQYQLACHVEGHYEAGMTTAFATALEAAAAPAPAPAADPASTQMPKTGGIDTLWLVALGLLALLVLVGGLALRMRKL
jgi:LPXTG-motif cell wall-anchored protein